MNLNPLFIGLTIYQSIFSSVDQRHLQELLKDMTGYNPVTVGSETFSITDRYSPDSKRSSANTGFNISKNSERQPGGNAIQYLISTR